MVPIFLTTETQKFHCQQFYRLMSVVAYLDLKTNTNYDALLFKFYFPCEPVTQKHLNYFWNQLKGESSSAFDNIQVGKCCMIM
jgi:hypothetical protein